VKFYYYPQASSLASHIALEEAGAAFEPVLIDFALSQQRSPEHLAVNPLGRVPVLIDGAEIITENPAILRYVARRFPEAGLWPQGLAGDVRCMEWLSFIVSSVHVAFAHVARDYRYATSDAAREEVREMGRATTRAMWDMVEARLAARSTRWAACDSFSVADPYLFVFWNLGRHPLLGYAMASDFPAWTDHARRLCDRPGAHRALVREGIMPPDRDIEKG
jgi:glutathione S-transferase